MPRRFCQWAGDLLLTREGRVPVWRGDVVRVKFEADRELLVRIVSFSGEFELEPYEGASDQTVRPMTYMGEIIEEDQITQEGTGLGYKTIARSLAELRELAGLFLVSKTRGPDKDASWVQGAPASLEIR